MEFMKCQLTDGTEIVVPKEIYLDSDVENEMCSLQYNLWEIFIQYMFVLGVEVKDSGTPDFGTVKQLEGTILGILAAHGVKFQTEGS